MSKFINSSFILGTFIVLSSPQSTYSTDGEKYVPDLTNEYMPSKNADVSTFYGPTTMKEANLNHSLKVMGPLTLKHTNIKGETVVYGPFIGQELNLNLLIVYGSSKIKNTRVGEISIYGPLSIASSKVSGPTTVKGPIHSKKTVFQKDISVASNIATFEDTTFQNIEIQRTDEIIHKSPVVYLKGKTIVEGDIIFASGDGKVIADKNVQIKGTIKGGVKE